MLIYLIKSKAEQKALDLVKKNSFKLNFVRFFWRTIYVFTKIK